ncbi:MAG: restriction endonuclease subunit S [Candidatus Eisenbacteria bacterium]|nr:restriction endonuclease subunit S [Candidatus Eisenbacteria bacterium]
MRRERIGDLLLKFSRKQRVLQSEYTPVGETPIVDQSTGTLVVGYTDNPEARHETPLPITVFGDHTRVVKYVDFPFASGADGTQLLYPNTLELDPTYFFYAIRNVDLSNYFYARHFKFLKEQQITIPALKAQHRIAETLRNYDDLIENNRRRMALLEVGARQLYREWFVRLRFPGHEHTRITNGVPEGWERVPLSELCESIDYGYTASAQQDEIGPKFLRITDIVPKVIDWTSVPYCPIEEDRLAKFRLVEGDIVIARTGATVGYAKRLHKRHPEAVFASYLVRLRLKPEVSNMLVGVFVESDAYKGYVQSCIGGAAQPNANARVLAAAEIFVPPRHLQHDFNGCIEPLFDQGEVLQLQNQRLRAARDLLLPRLMNGEIPV